MSSVAPRKAPAPRVQLTETDLRAATVTLVGARGQAYCTGAVAGRADTVVTAAHCLQRRTTEVRLRLSGNRRAIARVAAIDRSLDVAVLRAAGPLGPAPLPVVSSADASSEEWLLFLGQPRGNRQVQRARIQRRGRCPRLPTLRGALYGSYRGVPGDSGAPLVSADGIIGIVSGGRNCAMAIPAQHLWPLLQKAWQHRRDGRASSGIRL